MSDDGVAAVRSNRSRIRTAVLISGNGSNLQALLDAATAPDFPASIALVLSNKAQAYGLERARQAGVETHVISHKDFNGREAFDAAMHEVLAAEGIQLVCLAGFMRLLSAGFVHQWEGRMLNIHPSLLPAYKGLDTHQRVLDAGEEETGCTVHYVVPEMDAGEVIKQATVSIAPDDTAETLQQRVHAAEHRIYPEALRQVAQGLRG